MTSNINKEALTAFIDIVEEHSQGLITVERAVELTTSIGFSCRLACQMENWHQSVTFIAPPSTLSPVEAEIHTPWGDQNIELEQRSSLPRVVENALSELRHILEVISRGEGDGATTDQRQEFVVRAREMERTVVENSLQFSRSGSFNWPMDRFQLRIELGERSALVTVFGPCMAALARASLADATAPGVGVSDVAEAAVKLLLDRTIERGSSIGAGFRAREESLQAAHLLREYLGSLT
jgi:hypothetical protein